MEQNNVLLKRMCATSWNEDDEDDELSQTFNKLSIITKKTSSSSNSTVSASTEHTKLQKNESPSNGETLLTATCHTCGLFVCFPSGSARVCCYQCQAPIDVTAAMDEKVAHKIQKKQRRKSRQKENKQKKKVLVNQLLAEYKQKAEKANCQISSDSSPTATSAVPTSTTTPPVTPPASPNKAIDHEGSPLSNSISPPPSPSTVVPVPNIPTPIPEVDDSSLLNACAVADNVSFPSPIREEQIFSTPTKETSRFPTHHRYQHNNYDTMPYSTPPPSNNFYDRYSQFRCSNQHTFNSPYSNSPYSTSGSSNSSSTSPGSPCSPPRSLRENWFNITPVFMNGPLIPDYTSGTACPGCTFYVKQFNGSPSNSSFLRLRYNRENLYLSYNDQGYVWPIQQCHQVGLSIFIQFV